MSVTARQVKNKRTSDGGSTSRAGTVYDVFIRYKTAEGYKTYGKRGFLTKSEAIDHEAEMRTKLTNPAMNRSRRLTQNKPCRNILNLG